MTALRKILVVDDDPVVGKSFDRVLTNKGYEVVMAHNAAEALERMRKSEYDVVYTDIRMPGMDGLELAEKVKARRPWTPVVIVTGHGTVDNERRAMDAGVTAFLHKPLSPEMIEDSATEALQQGMAAGTQRAPVAAEVVQLEPAPVAVEAITPVRESRLKNVALFLAAPFIGLVYAVFMPIVGLGVLVWMAGKELATPQQRSRVMRGLTMMAKLAAAPFIGLETYRHRPLRRARHAALGGIVRIKAAE
ncbi:MAG: response regulator [Ideonella sp.]|nr:response regulator [Ideonella sp.]